jgi:L-aminopeptidase/D-esterase-like protein
VSVPLSKPLLAQLAAAATAAFYRRITPCGTSFDGDVLFAISPAQVLAGDAPSDIPLTRIEAVAIAALEHAIERGVTTARGRDRFVGCADLPEGATIA